MTTGKALNGKPYAGNPHVRFDEGEVAPAATPRRGSLLYKKIMATVAAAMVASCLTAFAVTVPTENTYLTATDDQGKTSFTDSARWADGSNPAESPDKVYLVASERTIRSPAVALSSTATTETNAVFGGKSLVLGNSNNYGVMAIKTTVATAKRGLAKVTVNDLWFANSGSYITHAGNNAQSDLYGNFTFAVAQSGITSSSVPYFNMSNGRIFDVYSTLVSEAGCGFKVIQGNASGGRVSLMSDNPNFLGYMAVDGTNAYLTAESAGALGPEPDEATPLIAIRNGGSFGVYYNDVTIDQPKRGIYLGTDGGNIYAASGLTLTTSMYITTDENNPQPLAKTGAGYVFVSGESTLKDVEIKEGRLGLAGEVTGSLVVSNNACLLVAATNSTLTLSCPLTLGSSGSNVQFQPDADGKPAGTLVLAKGFSLESGWPLKW